MSGKERKNEKEGEGNGDGGGGWSTFWKVAGAAAVVAGGIYSILEEAKQKQVAVGAGGSTSSHGLGMPTKETTVWTKPKVGWLKLNVDGSLLREIQSAGCGGVLRDNSGNWIFGFAQKLSPSSREDETEKEGILKGLKWAKEKGVRKVEVESDNKVTVTMVNDGNEYKDGYIVAIRKLLFSSDWQATLRWIPGDANGVADKLADIASKKLTSFDLKEFHSPPESCLNALAKDSPHLY